MPVPPIPTRIAAIAIPQDHVSIATWDWAQRALPAYLLAHSVRSYCWGATIAAAEGWSFDRRILWTAALMHDLGLTRIPRNTMCFEVEGAEIAQAIPRAARPAARAGRAGRDRDHPSHATRGGPSATASRASSSIGRRASTSAASASSRSPLSRDEVVRAFPRGDFDRRFLRAIAREVARRGDCQSARLLNGSGVADGMAHSPWATGAGTGTSGA